MSGLRRADRGHGSTPCRLDLKDRALEDFSRALELSPRSQIACYNIACVYAARGETDAALEWLGRAVDLGWRDAAYMAADEDLQALADEEAFCRLLDRLREDQHRTPL